MKAWERWVVYPLLGVSIVASVVAVVPAGMAVT